VESKADVLGVLHLTPACVRPGHVRHAGCRGFRSTLDTATQQAGGMYPVVLSRGAQANTAISWRCDNGGGGTCRWWWYLPAALGQPRCLSTPPPSCVLHVCINQTLSPALHCTVRYQTALSCTAHCIIQHCTARQALVLTAC
jgi:hypothetical protein